MSWLGTQNKGDTTVPGGTSIVNYGHETKWMYDCTIVTE